MSLSLGAEFTSEFTFAVLHCSGFDKCIETQILHYGITALEILYVLLIHPSFLMSPWQPLISWLVLCLFPECYIIRVLCNLFSLVSPLSNMCLSFLCVVVILKRSFVSLSSPGPDFDQLMDSLPLFSLPPMSL